MKVRSTLSVFATLFFLTVMLSGCFLDYMVKDSRTGKWRKATTTEMATGIIGQAADLGIIPGWMKAIAGIGLGLVGAGTTASVVTGKEHKKQRIVNGTILEELKEQYPDVAKYITKRFSELETTVRQSKFYRKYIKVEDTGLVIVQSDKIGTEVKNASKEVLK